MSGTISDNTSYALLASVQPRIHTAKIYGGYEHIEFANPKDPLAIGFDDIGGYKLGAVNNAAFPHARLYDVFWAGVKYTFWKQLDLTAAIYGLNQNSYIANTASCAPSFKSRQCSGDERTTR